MGGLADLWMVWLVCGWFRVLQLTKTVVLVGFVSIFIFCSSGGPFVQKLL